VDSPETHRFRDSVACLLFELAPVPLPALEPDPDLLPAALDAVEDVAPPGAAVDFSASSM